MLCRIALWGVVSVVALILAALAINYSDEPLSAQASALLEPPRDPYEPEDNFYIALAGFSAPAGQSIVSAGEASIARYNAQVDSMIRDPMQAISGPWSEPPALKLSGSLDLPHPRELPFWESVRTKRAKIEELVGENHELHERYCTLFSLQGYYETARPSVAAPIYIVPNDVRNLFLAYIASRIQNGDQAQIRSALTSLSQDVGLWHRMLTGEGGLISKMVAVSFLQTDSLILSDIIADPRIRIPEGITDFLPEFKLADWNIGSAFAGEFRLHTFVQRQTQSAIDTHWQPPDTTYAGRLWGRVLGPIEGRFYKFNATENLDAKDMTELASFAELDPSTFPTWQARYEHWEQGATNFLSIRSVYNPIGKVLVAIAAPAYKNYLLRPYDGAALQRLVRLSFEIRRQEVPPSGVEAFMRAHPEWSTHPIDGRPFVWRPATGEIAIHPIAQQPTDRRFSVRIWVKPAGEMGPPTSVRDDSPHDFDLQESKLKAIRVDHVVRDALLAGIGGTGGKLRISLAPAFLETE